MQECFMYQPSIFAYFILFFNNQNLLHQLRIKKIDIICRSSHRRCSVRKSGLRNLAKFTGKHLCQSFFFNKVADLSLQRY